VHDEHCGHDHGHHGHDHKSDIHDDGVKGISLTLDKPVDGQKITAWLNDLLARRGTDILRAKGIIDVKGENKRLVFQAVHMILEGDFQREWTDKDKRYSRMVFIGRDLDEAELKAGFEATAA
jgi:G3E family GTPase